MLNLNGQAGDDTFIVQAFALVGSKDNKRAITDISGVVHAQFSRGSPTRDRPSDTVAG